MKALVQKIPYPVFIRIALISMMLTSVFSLFGHVDMFPEISDSPVTYDYDVKHINLLYGIGAKYQYSYTISIDPKKITKLDQQRLYSIESNFFLAGKKHGSYTPVSSNIKYGQTFGYDQFPITGHLVIKFTGSIDPFSYQVREYLTVPEEIRMSVNGFAIKDERVFIQIEDYPSVIQNSDFTMSLPNPGDHAFIIKVYNLRVFLPGVICIALLLFILYRIIKRIVHLYRIDA
jgi:hypothetical protein